MSVLTISLNSIGSLHSCYYFIHHILCNEFLVLQSVMLDTAGISMIVILLVSVMKPAPLSLKEFKTMKSKFYLRSFPAALASSLSRLKSKSNKNLIILFQNCQVLQQCQDFSSALLPEHRHDPVLSYECYDFPLRNRQLRHTLQPHHNEGNISTDALYISTADSTLITLMDGCFALWKPGRL